MREALLLILELGTPNILSHNNMDHFMFFILRDYINVIFICATFNIITLTIKTFLMI